ncbi:MAG TPA: DUF488 domain-containing protein [Rhizomicrobium sp.]|nr:DUF488 domain-containing protein [Rhizomicrobium sp.]
MPTVQIKRIYAAPAAGDGLRILVDRIWPRGLSKQKAALDYWQKDIAPSTALRKWFAHKPERWAEFRHRYAEELAANPALAELKARMKNRHATLLYGARDTEHNQAVVLADVLSGHGK